MGNKNNPISFRAGGLYDELAKRGNPHLAAKFAVRRYFALVSEYTDRALAKFSEGDRAFLYSHVFPYLPLEHNSSMEMLPAWTVRAGGPEGLARKLRKATPGEIDALIDMWRQRNESGDLAALDDATTKVSS